MSGDAKILVVDDVPANMHRSSAGRIFKAAPHLRGRRVDELTVDDVAALLAALTTTYKRETIRKTRTALAQTLDFYELEPNVVCIHGGWLLRPLPLGVCGPPSPSWAPSPRARARGLDLWTKLEAHEPWR
jgi:hypothetical protein